MNTYYEQLEPLVLPNLKSHLSDLVEVDQETLANYDGSFIHAHNCEATSLALLDEKALKDTRNRELTESALFDANNTVFILGSKGKLRQLSRQRAMQIWRGVNRHLESKQQAVSSREAANQPYHQENLFG